MKTMMNLSTMNNLISLPLEPLMKYSIFGLDKKTDMCYSCGLEGTLDNFTQRNASGRLERRCPQCGSYEVHGKDALAAGDNYKFKDETYEEEIARRNEYYRKIHEENERRKREEE